MDWPVRSRASPGSWAGSRASPAFVVRSKALATARAKGMSTMWVKSEGDRHSGVMLIGEGPGVEEDRTGRPFQGKTGRDLNRKLDGDRLPAREEIVLTNMFRLYKGKGYKWTQGDVDECAPYLIKDLQIAQPDIVITMGRWSTRFLLGDVDTEDVHGIPWLLHDEAPAKALDVAWRAEPTVFPMYHIAAGWHSPEISGYVSYDFAQLAAFFAGNLKARKLYDDPYPAPTYVEIARAADIRLDPRLPLAIITEGSPARPWSV